MSVPQPWHGTALTWRGGFKLVRKAIRLRQRMLLQCGGGDREARNLLHMRKCVGPTPSHAKAQKHRISGGMREPNEKTWGVTKDNRQPGAGRFPANDQLLWQIAPTLAAFFCRVFNPWRQLLKALVYPLGHISRGKQHMCWSNEEGWCGNHDARKTEPVANDNGAVWMNEWWCGEQQLRQQEAEVQQSNQHIHWPDWKWCHGNLWWCRLNWFMTAW